MFVCEELCRASEAREGHDAEERDATVSEGEARRQPRGGGWLRGGEGIISGDETRSR